MRNKFFSLILVMTVFLSGCYENNHSLNNDSTEQENLNEVSVDEEKEEINDSEPTENEIRLNSTHLSLVSPEETSAVVEELLSVVRDINAMFSVYDNNKGKAEIGFFSLYFLIFYNPYYNSAHEKVVIDEEIRQKYTYDILIGVERFYDCYNYFISQNALNIYPNFETLLIEDGTIVAHSSFGVSHSTPNMVLLSQSVENEKADLHFKIIYKDYDNLIYDNDEFPKKIIGRVENGEYILYSNDFNSLSTQKYTFVFEDDRWKLYSIEANNAATLPDLSLREAGGLPWFLTYTYVPFPVTYYPSAKLTEKIEPSEYNDWQENTGFAQQMYTNSNPELIITRLTDSLTFYSFLLEFGDRFTNEEIIDAFKNRTDHMDFNLDFPYEITDEQMEAVLSMDEERILAAFISDFSIQKGVHYYTPEWLYYHTAEDYKNAEFTPEEVLRALNKCREMVGVSLRHTFIDVVEYNLYQFAQMIGSDLTITDICGYERDMSMPLPLGKTTEETYRGQLYFKGGPHEQIEKNIEELSPFDLSILKNGNKYTFAWVYHNKPSAYAQAGIMPEELIEMLPRYEALGILTDEAWAALESKIFEYAADGS
ncbi:MAG: hypothetical protein FWH05_00005 [Oscillospiraceae bacterium]|nr:hypothetical protein [Oscillospiraceae bacterium]